MSHCQRVVSRADLHYDAHIAGLIEVLEGIDTWSKPSVDALESHLKCTDILESLNSNSFTLSLFLVEIYRLHNASVNHVNQSYDCHEEDDLDDNLDCFVHFMVICLLIQFGINPYKVINLNYQMQYFS